MAQADPVQWLEIWSSLDRPARLEGSIQLLLAATLAAKHASPVKDIGIDTERLLATGLETRDLRWLNNQGYVERVTETTLSDGLQRNGRAVEETTLPINTRWTLSAKGISLARSLLDLINFNQHLDAAKTIADLYKPRWYRPGRRLWWRGELVKEFHVAAYSQECILDRFEEQGWPTHVDDPLPKADAATAKRRLRAAIQNLNRKQLKPLIHFQGNGRGTGVCWELTQATHDNRIQLSTQ